MRRNNLRTLRNILRHTKADRVLLVYIVFVFAAALLIWIFEPTITTYRGALWYCYAVISTAGFGDVVVTTLIPKILSVIITAYSLLVIAIVTGVVVNYYNQVIAIKDKETMIAFLDQVERLPELSKEELKTLSDQVKQFRKTGKIKKEPESGG